MDIYPNVTVFFQIANFLLLLFVLNFLVYRPIRRILGQRGAQITSFQKMIEDFQNGFEKEVKTLEGNMVSARKEGFKEKENLKNTGLEKEKVMVQEAISSVEQKIGKAKEEIERHRAQARHSLEEEVRIFSVELAEKILGRSI